MTAFPKVSVILVNWNTRALTDDALVSLGHFEKSIPLEVIVVDNASSDGSVQYLEGRHPHVLFIRNSENLGFARANNQGVAAASGDYVLLLNTDTRLTQEVLPACLEATYTYPDSIVGCRLLNADGSLQVSAETFPRLETQLLEIFSTSASARNRKLKALRPTTPISSIPVDWLTGAFLFLKRKSYQDLGGLSELIFMYGEDVEFCWRARQHGIQCRYLPGTSLIHLGGGGIDHASLRALVLSDAGRIRSFAIMRGRMQGILLRLIFMIRSLIRGPLFTVAGILKGNSLIRKKGSHHFWEVLILAGVTDARRFI